MNKKQIIIDSRDALDARDVEYWNHATVEEKLETITFLRECFYTEIQEKGKLFVMEQKNYYMINMQKILFVADELHKRGYEKLHIVPSVAPNGLAWRCIFVVASTIKNLSINVSSWISEFDWDENNNIILSTQELADLLEKKHRWFFAKCKGEDSEYVEWFSEMLNKLQEGELPYAFGDYFSYDGFWKTTLDNKIKTLPNESKYYRGYN